MPTGQDGSVLFSVQDLTLMEDAAEGPHLHDQPREGRPVRGDASINTTNPSDPRLLDPAKPSL